MAGNPNAPEIKGKRFCDMTPEERREAGRRGGIASGEAKRRKRATKEALEVLLAMPLKKGRTADIENINNFTALKGKNVTVDEALLVALIQKGLKGYLPAFEMILEILGEKPADTKNLNVRMPVVFEGEAELED